MKDGGSVKNLGNFITKDMPLEKAERIRFLVKKYKTVYELSQRVLLDMMLDRAPFICQTQSHNVFMENVNYAKLTSYHFAAWKGGAKTGMYYLRQNGKETINFALQDFQIREKSAKQRTILCTDEICVSCSS